MNSRAFALGCLVTFAAAGAQAQTPPEMPDYMALARVCVNEAGFECFSTGDGLAIHEVILRGAEVSGVSYLEFARRYSGRVLGVRPANTSRLRWVTQLSEDAAEPADWPRTGVRQSGSQRVLVQHAPWSDYRERWLRVVARAREVVRLRYADVTRWSPCRERVRDWGGSMDRGRAQRLNLIRVECGETRNDFYQRPRREG